MATNQGEKKYRFYGGNMIRYPNFDANDMLGITAISDGANGRIDFVISKLKKLKKELVISKYLKESQFQISASAEERSKEFIGMWTNSKIGYIIAAFGGEFCMEVLPYIHTFLMSLNSEDKLIDKIPWFQGFSDASFINFYLTTNYNISTIHGYNAEDYGMKENIKKLALLMESLRNYRKGFLFEQTSPGYHTNSYLREDINTPHIKNDIKILNGQNEACFSGTLIGGWIEALVTICGTKYDNTAKFCQQFEDGMAWYIDNCELSSPMLRRKLWQLKESGYFNNCNGILIGRLPRDEFTGEYDYMKALHDSFDDLDIPVVTGVDIGHFFPQWTLINGSYARVEVNGNDIKMIQKLR